MIVSFVRQKILEYFRGAAPPFPGCAACPTPLRPLAERVCRSLAPDFPVDIVYTWVDGGDPAHRAARAAALAALPEPPFDERRARGALRKKLSVLLGKTLNSGGNGSPAHFRDNQELRYALRSVEAFLPWARRIFIITAGQKPAWLRMDDERLRLVDHQEIIPHEYLPTFSSRVIEAHLHAIPDLAEHFIYCNDDFFFARPCGKEEFFTTNGLPYVYVDWRVSRREGYRTTGTPHAQSFFNVLAYMRAKGLEPEPLLIAAHCPHPQTRSNAAEAFAFFEEGIRAFLPNRFRTMADMVFHCHAVPLWAYAMQRTVPCDERYYYLNTRRRDRREYYAAMLAAPRNTLALPPFFCLNDVGPVNRRHSWQEDLQNFFQEFFPKPSSFEKTP